MRILTFMAAVILVVAPHWTEAAPAQGTLLPASTGAAGLSKPELSVRWWKWAGSFDYDESPVSDGTGERCAARQEGPVWFLAGTYGSRPAKRTCHVPSGKHLFFPLINYVVMPSNCGDCLTCDQATGTTRKITDDVMGLFAELDGVPLQGLNEHRVASKA